MKTISPLRKPDSLRSHVENFLREAIMEGQFKPGDRLRERELCEMLEVSRPSLREALRKLEAEKLITNVLHRGPVVASISNQEAADIYAIRALLESHVVFEFTRLANDEQVAELGQAVQQLHAVAALGDRKLLLLAKARFYDILLAGCGNQLVSEMLMGLLSRVNLLRAKSFSKAGRLPESLKEINQIFLLVFARDADAAREATRLHILNAEKAAMTVLEAQSISP